MKQVKMLSKLIYFFINIRNKAQLGFTLIEVLISTFIIGIILSLIFFSIDSLNHNLLSNKKVSENQKSILLTLSTIEQDFSSLVDRPVRDKLGEYEPAVLLTNNTFSELSFTRSFYDNADKKKYLVRIHYTQNEGVYERRIWEVLDRVQDTNYETHFFDPEILNLKILAASLDGKWNEFWPISYDQIYLSRAESETNRNISRDDILRFQSLSSRKVGSSPNLPIAIKIIIEHGSLGVIERVLLL